MKDILGLPKRKKKRTLTTVQKRDIMYKAGNRCRLCRKKFSPSVLRVHHIKEVSKHKEEADMFGLSSDMFGYEEKKKPEYDKESNLIVLCPNCHAKYHAGILKKSHIKKAKTGKKGKKRKKKAKKKDDLFGDFGW